MSLTTLYWLVQIVSESKIIFVLLCDQVPSRHYHLNPMMPHDMSRLRGHLTPARMIRVRMEKTIARLIQIVSVNTAPTINAVIVMVQVTARVEVAIEEVIAVEKKGAGGVPAEADSNGSVVRNGRGSAGSGRSSDLETGNVDLVDPDRVNPDLDLEIAMVMEMLIATAGTIVEIIMTEEDAAAAITTKRIAVSIIEIMTKRIAAGNILTIRTQTPPRAVANLFSRRSNLRTAWIGIIGISCCILICTPILFKQVFKFES